jgi:hypothetical protein
MNWFSAWLKAHLNRHPFARLPNPADNPDFYAAWKSEFARLRVTEQAAHAASVMLTSKTYYPKEHFKTLLDMAKESREQERQTAIAAPTTFAECCYCDGHGTVEVLDDLTSYRWGAFCVCDRGRAMLSQARMALKDGRQPLDYADVLDGKRFMTKRGGERVEVTYRPAREPDDETDYTHLFPGLARLAEGLKGVTR